MKTTPAWHVVSDEDGLVLAVYSNGKLAAAQEAARSYEYYSGLRTYLHFIVCNARPSVGQSISMKGVRR